MNLRILVADDHSLVRRGIRSLLESRPGWTVCAEAKTGRDAVEKAEQLQPDIAVLDISMPDLNGIDAAQRIRKACPHTEVLMLSVHYSDEIVRQVIEAGVRGYVVKTDAERDLPKAIETLSAHKPFFTPLATDAVLHNIGKGNVNAEPTENRLTSREREILQLISEGKSSKEVANALRLSSKTVDTHRSNLMRKLAIRNVATLVRYAVRHHLTEP